MPKTVFITGGSSGIGKSIGDYLTQKGFEVYGSSRSPKKYKDSKFTLVELDVTKPESIQKCMEVHRFVNGKLAMVRNRNGCEWLRCFISAKLCHLMRESDDAS